MKYLEQCRLKFEEDWEETVELTQPTLQIEMSLFEHEVSFEVGSNNWVSLGETKIEMIGTDDDNDSD
ncbi:MULTISPECIES: hypothetical protein [Gammaproteobacteria]|uniref:hypothetical protein n=1 Tax=Gammaproteobacteria TaxID=1236 RepID=UPI000DCFF782|nr:MULTISPECIES: hypothetical protein [Gammaproteobacteria]RTE87192.1 hypothetical protein DQX04_02045 [Aliidiomarina sp. B3213]TCZ93020.1 hypothetical protein EYQ95_03260 [Lysobacter sp. N42]